MLGSFILAVPANLGLAVGSFWIIGSSADLPMIVSYIVRPDGCAI